MTASIEKTHPLEPRSAGFDVTNIWVLLSIIVSWLVLLPTLQQSMFFDGLIYASIGRNMADGTSIWRPYFSDTLFPLFAEHPPLMMMLEAALFRIFGDHIWVEKIFSAALIIPTSFVLVKIWQHIAGQDAALARLAPLFLIFTLICGKFSWAYSNNMLENMLVLLGYASALCSLSAVSSKKLKSKGGFLIASGLLTFLAVLVKGPVGLFPLATIGIYWLTRQSISFRNAFVSSLCVVAVLCAAMGALALFQEPRLYMQRYFQDQVMASLSGSRGHEGGGAYAVWTLIRVTLYPAAFTIGTYAACQVPALKRRWTASVRSEPRRLSKALFYFSMGLASSLPLLVSPRIYSFYFNIALPWYAAGWTVLIAAPISTILAAFPEKTILLLRKVYTLALAVSLAIVLFSFGTPGRDEEMIRTANAVADQVCENTPSCRARIASCGDVGTNWQLHAYLQRLHRISLEPGNGPNPSSTNAHYVLASSSCALNELEQYMKMDLPSGQFTLWTKRNSVSEGG